jgi:hypothetical protein
MRAPLLTLALLLGCGDPRRDAPAAECCADEECGEGQLCHFSYACRELDGARICDAPTGDRRCHDLCGQDTAAPCDDAGQFCQTLSHAQGEDVYETVSACF